MTETEKPKSMMLVFVRPALKLQEGPVLLSTGEFSEYLEYYDADDMHELIIPKPYTHGLLIFEGHMQDAFAGEPHFIGIWRKLDSLELTRVGAGLTPWEKE